MVCVFVLEAVAASTVAGAFILIGNCDCVGALSAYLGSSYSNLIGAYSSSVDNIISFNLVNTKGELKTIIESYNLDLF